MICRCGHERGEHQDGWSFGVQWCCACPDNGGKPGEAGACSQYTPRQAIEEMSAIEAAWGTGE